MALIGKEIVFNGSTVPYASYDSTKTTLGTLIFQRGTAVPPYAGPPKIALARPIETAGGFTVGLIDVLQWSSTIDWIFCSDNTAAATQRVLLYEWNKSTFVYTCKGSITVGFPFSGTQGTYIPRGFQAAVSTYSTGTVDVSGTGVTGHSTAWQTARFAVGGRIGFGTTDPTAVTTWYEISAITNDTSITLLGAAPTVTGVSYVIEEVRLIWAVTNGTTAANGGLFITKGLHAGLFSAGAAGGTVSVAAAVSTDNVRATYWLSDQATNSSANMQTAVGVVIDTEAVNHLTHNAYFVNGGGGTTCRVLNFNIRAALTLSSGLSTSGLTLQTGNQSVTGNLQQQQSATIATLGHGPGSGASCIYIASTTRISRVAVSGITAASTTFVSDSMTEVPPGGTATFAATGALKSTVYESTIDRLIVITSNASGFRNWVTQYNTGGSNCDSVFGIDNRVIYQANASPEISPSVESFGNTIVCGYNAGWTHFLCSSAITAATNNVMYAVPTDVDWAYASTTNQRLIAPKIDTSDASKLIRFYFNVDNLEGGNTLGMVTEPVRFYYRTSGIDDNSGTWVSMPTGGILTGVTPTSIIQFMAEFRIFGLFSIPGQVYSIAVVYEDSTTDSHYEPLPSQCDVNNKRFAWRFVKGFGTTVPALRVRIYNAVTGASVIDDNTGSPSGTFEKSTNGGGSWVAWTNADKGNETTYLRYTNAAVTDSIVARALLTQL